MDTGEEFSVSLLRRLDDMSRKFTATEITDSEAGLKALPEPALDDPDNPEWTMADFARAVGPEALSELELAAFPKTRMNRTPRH